MGRAWPGLIVLLAFGCGDEPVEAESFGAPKRSHGLSACIDDGVDGVFHPGYRCHTYRGIGGISMGGGSASRIALQSPELFDVVTALGAPYIDMEYFLVTVSETSNGGFCPMDQLLSHLDDIDVKNSPDTWCGPVDLPELAMEGTRCAGFSGDFNHHFRGPDAGRGGSFNREGSFEIVHDLALAFGNPAFYNPDSPYLPPGVPISHHVPLELSAEDRAAERQALRQQICASPIRLEGFHDRTYNPEGRHPVITFCDGNGPVTGEYEPGARTFPVEVVLAVDYNDNGYRDYGEPVLSQPFEPYDDFGLDRIASVGEAGYDETTHPDPAGDDFHWLHNPTGTEGNYRFDEGEALEDVGLDGVPGTGDFGEGNGRFDLNPNIERAFASSPRRLIEELDARMLSRLHIWADAGIRDFLHSAQITNQFWGALMHRSPQARRFDDWSGLAQAIGTPAELDTYVGDFSEEAVGRHAYLRYGDPSVCPGVDETGRGNHVGTADEVLNRLLSAMAFASARWPDGDFGHLSGALSDQGSPNGSLSDFVRHESYASEVLGTEEPYTVVLPPDYYRDSEDRYPVLYFLHGQGMKAKDLSASALLFVAPQMVSEARDRKGARSDWQKMIIVFADGECQPGECHTGNFYADFVGIDGEGPKNQEAFFELMRAVDQRFRTKPAAMRGPADG